MDRDYASVTWNEALRSFLLHLKAVRAPKTVLFYRSRLLTLARWANEHSITIDAFKKRHLDEFLGERLDEGVSRTTLRHDALTTKVFLKWCAKNDIIERSPLSDYAIPKQARTHMFMPTGEDMQTLMEAMHRYWAPSQNTVVRYLYPGRRILHRDRNFAIVLTLLDSACRIGEVLSLKLDDYQPSARQFHIRETKGKEARSIPVSDDCARAISHWLKIRSRIMKDVAQGQDEGWLFMSEAGGPIDPGRFLKTLKKVTEFASLSRKISLHSLWCFSLNRLAKHNLLGAQAIAGHKDSNTTLLYTRIEADFVRDIHSEVGVVRGILTSKRATVRKRLL